LLEKLPHFVSEKLVTADVQKADAAVYKLTDDMYGVFTVDVFSPIVDDPVIFGKIVLANCISDVCAMGGTPVLGLNLCMFPKNLEIDALGEILKGASQAAIENGVLIVGGHTTDDKEIKYGLSVFGLVSPKELRLSSNAKPGDHVILTKALGTGILYEAKNHMAVDFDFAVKSMIQSNKTASEILKKYNCDCCTDVTGFGLGVSAFEVARESEVSISIHAMKLPLLPGVLEASKFHTCPVLAANIDMCGKDFINDGTEPHFVNILFDAQTSGGLLAFVDAGKADECVVALKRADYEASDIGEVFDAKPPKIFLRS